jgi:hypothetical protein
MFSPPTEARFEQELVGALYNPVRVLRIIIRENFLFLRKGFGSPRTLFFHKETRKPRVFKKRILVFWFPCGLSFAAVPR